MTKLVILNTRQTWVILLRFATWRSGAPLSSLSTIDQSIQNIWWTCLNLLHTAGWTNTVYKPLLDAVERIIIYATRISSLKEPALNIPAFHDSSQYSIRCSQTLGWGSTYSIISLNRTNGQHFSREKLHCLLQLKLSLLMALNCIFLFSIQKDFSLFKAGGG